MVGVLLLVLVLVVVTGVKQSQLQVLRLKTEVWQFFDLMFSLESDKITALWPNDSLTFTYFMIFSNSIPKWATFVKELFWFDV